MNDPCTVGQLLGQCGHLVRLYMNQQLRSYQITPVQSHALMYLSEMEGVAEVTQRDLERELRLKAPTVNGVVDRLAERQLLSRTTSASDRRCRLLQLSSEGREAAAHFSTALGRVEELFCAELSPEEQQALRDMLTRLIANLEIEVSKG